MIAIVVLAISALIQLITVGAVSFNSTGSVDGNSTFNCNSNVTLVCKSEQRPVNIVLLINGIQTIVCGQSCFVNRPVLGRYTAEHNASVGLINLYLPSVNETDQAKLFTCQDIQSTDDIRPKIIVYPERDKVSMVIHVLDNDVQITVATGCVLLDEKITFVWSIIKDEPNSLPLSVSNKEFVQNDTEDNGHCKSSENCGATGKSSVLTFKKASDGTGERYYVQCTVVVNDESVPGRISLISNRTFFLTGQTTATTTDTTPTSSTSTTTATTTTQTTTTTTTTTETTTTSSNTSSKSSSSVTTTPAVPGTTQNLNESIRLFFKKYKFEAIAVGCSLIVILIALAFLVFVIKRREKKRKEKITRRALQLSNLNS